MSGVDRARVEQLLCGAVASDMMLVSQNTDFRFNCGTINALF